MAKQVGKSATATPAAALSDLDPAAVAEALSILRAEAWKETCEKERLSPAELRKWRMIATRPIVMPNLESEFTKRKRRFKRRGSPHALIHPGEVAEQRAGDLDVPMRADIWLEILDPVEFEKATTVEEKEEFAADFDSPVRARENAARAASSAAQTADALVVEVIANRERLKLEEKEAFLKLEEAKSRREEFLTSRSPEWREALLGAVSTDHTGPSDAATNTKPPQPARAAFAPRAPGEGKSYIWNSATGQREEM
jgi:hypothetical protein